MPVGRQCDGAQKLEQAATSWVVAGTGLSETSRWALRVRSVDEPASLCSGPMSPSE